MVSEYVIQHTSVVIFWGSIKRALQPIVPDSAPRASYRRNNWFRPRLQFKIGGFGRTPQGAVVPAKCTLARATRHVAAGCVVTC